MSLLAATAIGIAANVRQFARGQIEPLGRVIEQQPREPGDTRGDEMLGEDVRRGRIPGDRALLSDVVRRICCRNALEYFGFTPGAAASP